jgi:hypothetical protein
MRSHSQYRIARAQQDGWHYIRIFDFRRANSTAAIIRRSPLLSEEPLLQRRYSRPLPAKIIVNCGSWAS